MQQASQLITMARAVPVVFVIWLAGCASLPAPPLSSKLALIYKPDRSTTYRMVSESTRSVEWQGLTPQAMEQVQGGTTGRVLDLTVTETVVQVDPNGHAILDIKIDRLSYRGFTGGDVSLDYDSQRADNAPSALASLVGARYRIEVDGRGKALRVISPFTGLRTLDPQTPHLQTARGLISEEAILSRHSIDALAGLADSSSPASQRSDALSVKPGTSWSVTRDFDFGIMGPKTFEKTYTMKDIKTVNDIPMASVEMTAVPEPNASGSSFGSMVTSRENYTGELQFDLAAGQVAVWQETLEINWTFVDPATANLEEGQQRRGLMKARQALLLQRLSPDS